MGATDSTSTCWTSLDAAAGGDPAARGAFAARYEPMVRAYLAARWRASPLARELDDAVQDVFVECLRPGGALARARPDGPGGFRAYLYGLVRHVALRHERAKARRREAPDGAAGAIGDAAADETTLSRAFDRAWARAILREAAAHQAAGAIGDAAAGRRVELLRLRFGEGRPIREIARLWGADPTLVHRDYARARAEFRAALLDVLAFHHPGAPAAIERECRELLELLG